MEQWIEIAKEFGVLAVILGLIAWKGWPLFVKQLEQAQASHRHLEEKLTGLSEKFADTIRARDVIMAEIQERNLKALEGLSAKITGSKIVREKRK